jgi:four helix bundle protein
MGDYHNLEVWHLACQLSDRIYFLVERLGKRINPSKADQILRAADGIHENIAEGCGYNSDRQLAKYLRQAIGSTDETQDELGTLMRRRLLPESDYDLLPAAKLIAKKTNALLATVGGKKPPKRRPPRDD